MSAKWQLLRERPPGYGGVERVAHELAQAWHAQGSVAVVFSFSRRQVAQLGSDPLSVAYRRVSLPSVALGRLLLPLPSRQLFRLLTAT